MAVKPLPKLTSMVAVGDIMGPCRLNTVLAKLLFAFSYYFLINTGMASVAIFFLQGRKKTHFDTVNTMAADGELGRTRLEPPSSLQYSSLGTERIDNIAIK